MAQARVETLVPLSLVVLALCLEGCAANSYSRFYTSTAPSPAMAARYLVPTDGEPDIRYGSDQKSDYLDMVENGYSLVGYSSFWAPPQSREAAVAAAYAAHAAVAIVYSSNARTVTQTTPVVDLSFVQDVLNPKTQTTQTSGTVYGGGGALNYSQTSTTTVPREPKPPQTVTTTSTVCDQFASFWAKAKTPRLGILPRDLSAEERAARGTNKGLVVAAVIKGSPAFAADVMRGDIITKIGDVTLTQQSDFESALDRYAGSGTDLAITRGGVDKTVHLRLNSSQ